MLKAKDILWPIHTISFLCFPQVDTKEQLRNVQNLRVVKYAYRQEFADQAGMRGDDTYDTGVIDQEVSQSISSHFWHGNPNDSWGKT